MAAENGLLCLPPSIPVDFDSPVFEAAFLLEPVFGSGAACGLTPAEGGVGPRPGPWVELAVVGCRGRHSHVSPPQAEMGDVASHVQGHLPVYRSVIAFQHSASFLNMLCLL